MSVTSGTAEARPLVRPSRVRRASAVLLPVVLLVLLLAVLVAAGLSYPVAAPLLPAAVIDLTRLLAAAGPVAAPVAALLVGVAMLLSRLSARRARSQTTQTLRWIQELHVCAAPLDRRHPAPVSGAPVEATVTAPASSPAVARRVLELQVRTLEAALAEQVQRADDVRQTLEGQYAVAARRDQERAVLVTHALREALAGETGTVAADRVAAALNRVATAPSFTRPSLAASSLVVPLSSFRPVAPPAPAAEPAPTAEPASALEQPVEAAAPVETELVASPAPHRVLPVPAPRAAIPHPRGRNRSLSRRRMRRSTAA